MVSDVFFTSVCRRWGSGDEWVTDRRGDRATLSYFCVSVYVLSLHLLFLLSMMNDACNFVCTIAT